MVGRLATRTEVMQLLFLLSYRASEACEWLISSIICQYQEKVRVREEVVAMISFPEACLVDRTVTTEMRHRASRTYALTCLPLATLAFFDVP